MSHSSFQPATEFVELLSLYAAGTLDAEGSARLEALLSEARENRRFFRRYLRADTALRESACGGVGLASSDTARTTGREPWYWKAAAAVAVLACLGSLWFSRRADDPHSADAHVRSEAVAVLTQSVGVRWTGGVRPVQCGSPLAAGTFAFEQGLVQLEFVNGAVVVAEGPAELELISGSRAICHRGKVRASVPPQARGFTITAPEMNVVDLGTEFGLAVGADGKSQLHVIEGEVRMEPKDATPASLFAGQGWEWGAGVQPVAMKGTGSVFTSRADLLTLSGESSQATLGRWQAESSRIRALPETVFHYTFEPAEPWSRTLPNLAANAAPGLNGAVVGCQWTQGRWAGKRALEFKGPSDRVRIQIPGQYRSMTLACWVRVEGWDRWLSSLLLTDEFKDGAIHWQLSDKGEMILGLHPGGMENHFSPPVIGPNDLGRWVFLVTTYDEESRAVTHYLDGRMVGATPIKTPALLSPGAAELGNWTADTRYTRNKVRSLNGRMDEFTFYSKALTPAEVQAAYASGTPR